MNLYGNNNQQGQSFGGNYGGGGGNGGNQSPVPDYFKNVSPEMINFGLNAGQDMLNKQRDKWMPGLSGFWHSLKYYFSVSFNIIACSFFEKRLPHPLTFTFLFIVQVSNSYVLKKISVILYPASNKVWNRLQADEFEREGEVSTTQQTDSFALAEEVRVELYYYYTVLCYMFTF